MEVAEVSASGQSQTLICGELKPDVQTLVGFTVSIRGKFHSSGCLLDLLVSAKPHFFSQVSVCVSVSLCVHM